MEHWYQIGYRQYYLLPLNTKTFIYTLNISNVLKV